MRPSVNHIPDVSCCAISGWRASLGVLIWDEDCDVQFVCQQIECRRKKTFSKALALTWQRSS